MFVDHNQLKILDLTKSQNAKVFLDFGEAEGERKEGEKEGSGRGSGGRGRVTRIRVGGKGHIFLVFEKLVFLPTRTTSAHQNKILFSQEGREVLRGERGEEEGGGRVMTDSSYWLLDPEEERGREEKEKGKGKGKEGRGRDGLFLDGGRFLVILDGSGFMLEVIDLREEGEREREREREKRKRKRKRKRTRKRRKGARERKGSEGEGGGGG